MLQEKIVARDPVWILEGGQVANFSTDDRNTFVLTRLQRGVKFLENVAKTGVYRIVPLADMFMRSAIEPYDGTILASAFTNTIYYRNKNLWK
ncbi:MAG: hypothetical protein QXD41_02380 [Nitrososphaeria archaeon]